MVQKCGDRIYKKNNLNACQKDTTKKEDISLCKQFLGVKKHCPNAAARNGLGRPSSKLTIQKNILNFYIRSCKKSSKQ